MQVRNGGVWKTATPSARVAGVWQPVKEVWVRKAAAWVKEWQNFNVLASTTVTPGRRVATAIYAEGYTEDAIGFGQVNADTFNIVSIGGSINPTAVGGGAVLNALVVGTYLTTGGPASPNRYGSMDIRLGLGGGFWQMVRGISFAGVYVRGTMIRGQDFKTGNPLDYAYFQSAQEPGETNEAWAARSEALYLEMYDRLRASPTSTFQVLYIGD